MKATVKVRAIEKRIEDYKTGKSEIMITLYTAEEIADFLYSI